MNKLEFIITIKIVNYQKYFGIFLLKNAQFILKNMKVLIRWISFRFFLIECALF